MSLLVNFVIMNFFA